MARTTYDNGLPFTSPLEKDIDDLIKRVDKKKAVLIIVDGQVGEGKTTAGVHLLKYINQKKGLPTPDLNGYQFAIGGMQFQEKIGLCQEMGLPAILYDEAGDFNKRGSLTKFNLVLNRTFETFRAFKCIVIMTLPSFSVLDSAIFDKGIPRMLIHVSDRTENYGNYSVYDLEQMLWLRKYMMNEFKYHKIKAYSYINPLHRGHFLDLPDDESKELDKISIASKLAINKKSLVEVEGLVTFTDIASKLNMKISWVRNHLKQLGAKPKRKIGTVKYFEPDLINTLADLNEGIQ